MGASEKPQSLKDANQLEYSDIYIYMCVYILPSKYKTALDMNTWNKLVH